MRIDPVILLSSSPPLPYLQHLALHEESDEEGVDDCLFKLIWGCISLRTLYFTEELLKGDVWIERSKEEAKKMGLDLRFNDEGFGTFVGTVEGRLALGTRLGDC